MRFFRSMKIENHSKILVKIWPLSSFHKAENWFYPPGISGTRPTKRTPTASKATGKSHLRMRRIEPRLNQPQRQGRLWRKRPPPTKILITWTARYSTRKERFKSQSQWLGRWAGGIQATASNHQVRSLNFFVCKNFVLSSKIRKARRETEYSMPFFCVYRTFILLMSWCLFSEGNLSNYQIPMCFLGTSCKVHEATQRKSFSYI